MTLVYIHGAGSTSDSFNYIRKRIGSDDVVLNYSSANGFENNLNDMTAQLKQFNGAYLIGGARDQCLREVELLMNAFNIRYKRIDSLVYT